MVLEGDAGARDLAEGERCSYVKAEELRDWMAGQSHTLWTELLNEAIEEYTLEAGDAETSKEAFIEWLAEWGREVRRRQRGLLLLTAHRAKGLEFAHVVVLDGAWEKTSRNEDADAARRLYYVAMTRARRTLILATRAGKNPFVGELHDNPSVLCRPESEILPSQLPELRRRYRRLSLSDVFLGFEGYRRRGHKVHRAIGHLSPGDKLQVRNGRERWELIDETGVVVGQLARGFEKLSGFSCGSATVMAVATWDRERSEAEYQDRLNCGAWEVVVPELVFEPDRFASGTNLTTNYICTNGPS